MYILHIKIVCIYPLAVLEKPNFGRAHGGGSQESSQRNNKTKHSSYSLVEGFIQKLFMNIYF